MRAGEATSNQSVSPCEKVDGRKDSVDEVVEEESDEEDLGMEMGEACERVRVKGGGGSQEAVGSKTPNTGSGRYSLGEGARGI